MRSMLVFLMLTLLAWSWAQAGQPTATGPQTEGIPYEDPGLMRDVMVWCQMPDYATLLSSQIDVVYPFDSGCADDYQSPGDYAVTSVQWWGGYWNPQTQLGPVEYFIITVYKDNGNCGPGEMIYQEDITEYTEINVQEDYYEYFANIPPLLQDAGQWYWFEVQGVMVFGDRGQWGWTTSVEPINCTPLQGFPLLGTPYWTPVAYPAMAFCLFSDETIDAETHTWGDVKAMFR